MEIRVRVPKVPSGLGANLLGLVGLVAVAVAVGGLTGNWWWSMLLGGLEAFGLAWVAQAQTVEPAEVASAAPVSAGAPVRVTEDERARDIAYMRGRPATAS